MTIVVTVKVTDGLVLAADSAATFYLPGAHGSVITKIYNHANKIFNLRKGLSIGAMVYGAGGIGASSVETLSKDLRRRFSDVNDGAYYLGDTYTIEEVAIRSRRFLYEESYLSAFAQPPADFFMGYRVCGYSGQASLPEVWEFIIAGPDCGIPYQIQGVNEFGLRWAGENEALDRLMLGAASGMMHWLTQKGLVQPQDADALQTEFINQFCSPLALPAMPIQDAIDVAKFAVETAAKYAKYGLRPETIGGPIELAAITKHEGFKWVSRKHYYSEELNRETDHGH